jgi:4-hydroxy-3-polyprenylbenzoate decarboxylase
LISPGILALEMPKYQNPSQTKTEIIELKERLKNYDTSGFPLIVIVDDAEFVSIDFNNFLWVTFTRSNPSHDIYGIGEFIENKHWGCLGALIIDARKKPHHAPELVADKEVESKVDHLFHSVESLKPYA